MKAIGSWYSRAKADAEIALPRNERVVGIGIVVFCVLMIIYFGAHQMQTTGFFTSNTVNLGKL